MHVLGAGSRNRTGTLFPARDFESLVQLFKIKYLGCFDFRKKCQNLEKSPYEAGIFAEQISPYFVGGTSLPRRCRTYFAVITSDEWPS
jgi:hypothetical protein